MKKFVLNALALLSLLACAVFLWLWQESYHVWRDMGYCWADYSGGRVHFIMMSSAEGRVIFSSVLEKYPRSLNPSGVTQGIRFQADSTHSHSWSFAMASIMQIGQFGNGYWKLKYAWKSGIPYGGYEEDVAHVAMPCWLAALVALILPVWQTISFVRQRRRGKEGECPKCGYDLRAHKPGDKCPECGTPIDSPSPTI